MKILYIILIAIILYNLVSNNNKEGFLSIGSVLGMPFNALSGASKCKWRRGELYCPEIELAQPSKSTIEITATFDKMGNNAMNIPFIPTISLCN